MPTSRVIEKAEKHRDKLHLQMNEIEEKLEDMTPQEVRRVSHQFDANTHRVEFQLWYGSLVESLTLDDDEDHRMLELTKFYFELGCFNRKLDYLAAGKEFWELPTGYRNVCLRQNRAREMEFRYITAGRIARLLAQTDPTTQQPANNFEGLLTDPFALKDILPEQFFPLISTKSNLDLEWQILVHHIGYSTMVRPRSQATESKEALDCLVKAIKYYPIFLERFTTEPTTEELQASDDSCFVCTKLYSSTIADGDHEEPLKLRCGHLIGQGCLRTMISMNIAANDRCPYRCHTKMYETADMLPKAVVDAISALANHRATFKDFDARINKHLLHGIDITYDVSLGTLLHELQEWKIRYRELEEAIREAFEEAVHTGGMDN